MEKRELNVSFAKSGSGSISSRVSLPKKWMDKMNITLEEREIYLIFDEEKEEIILKKRKK